MFDFLSVFQKGFDLVELEFCCLCSKNHPARCRCSIHALLSILLSRFCRMFHEADKIRSGIVLELQSDLMRSSA